MLTAECLNSPSTIRILLVVQQAVYHLAKSYVSPITGPGNEIYRFESYKGQPRGGGLVWKQGLSVFTNTQYIHGQGLLKGRHGWAGRRRPV